MYSFLKRKDNCLGEHWSFKNLPLSERHRSASNGQTDLQPYREVNPGKCLSRLLRCRREGPPEGGGGDGSDDAELPTNKEAQDRSDTTKKYKLFSICN